MNQPNLVQDLKAADVERILARRFPSLTPLSVAYLGAGMDSVAFEINQKWVFRFPLRRDVEAQLFVERAILPVLAPLLPIAIPQFTFDGAPAEDMPFHFAGYEKLPGVSATDMPPERTNFPQLAAQLGRFLTALHRFPVAGAERLGVRTQHTQDDFELVRESALAILPGVAGYVGASNVERLRRHLSDVAPVTAPPWPLTLTHYDLAAEHVLVDTTGSCATGVIDWGDVSIGDATVDFVGLFAWGGESFVRDVLANYEGVADERVLDRVRPWSTFRAVQDIQFGVEHDQRAVVDLAVRSLEREMK